jgi:hypothetical protein
VVRTDQNSIFLDRTVYILNQLYIMVFYINYYGLKNQISAQNSNVLVFDFIETHQFVLRTDRNSVFLGYEAHILDQLYIMIMYINSYGF